LAANTNSQLGDKNTHAHVCVLPICSVCSERLESSPMQAAKLWTDRCVYRASPQTCGGLLLTHKSGRISDKMFALWWASSHWVVWNPCILNLSWAPRFNMV